MRETIKKRRRRRRTKEINPRRGTSGITTSGRDGVETSDRDGRTASATTKIKVKILKRKADIVRKPRKVVVKKQNKESEEGEKPTGSHKSRTEDSREVKTNHPTKENLRMYIPDPAMRRRRRPKRGLERELKLIVRE